MHIYLWLVNNLFYILIYIQNIFLGGRNDLDTNEIVDVIKLFFILIFILTIATEIGFLIQKIIIDIRIVAISAAISVLMFIIISAKSIIFAALISLVLYVSLLDKLVSKDGEIPGVILASIIGIGIEVLVIINYSSSILSL